MSGERQGYCFGPLERRGLLGGIRAGQAATLGLGILAAIFMLDSVPSTVGALAGMLALALAAVVVTARLGGRTVEEWGPVAGAFALRLIGGRHRFRSAAPAGGMVWSAAGRSAALREPKVHTPPALRDVAIVETEYRDRRVGALSERGGKRLTAVLACRVVVVRAAGRRRAGASPRSLGPRSLRSRRDRRSPNPMDRADRAGAG